ncbi:MAG: DUF308 domain-containing protein [Lachnospiraceae bacterium]|nr:DUF308 domain-containing protein [Lachnospiraceae bacterium]
MDNIITENIKFNGWKDMLLFGILVLILGIFALVWTGMTIKIYVMVVGIITIMVGFSTIFNAHQMNGDSNLYLLKGVVEILFGTLMLFLPIFMATVAVFMMAFFFIMFGVALLFAVAPPVEGFNFGKYASAFGIIFIILGIIFIIFPDQTLIAATWIIGVILIVLGISCIGGGWKLKQTFT